MRQLTVISGKGGTGKTSIAAAFAALASDAVLADCDVDAADLHLLLDPSVERRMDFTGLPVAVIDSDTCTACGRCREHCVFDAIDASFVVQPAACEGCSVCAYVCPVDAIEMQPRTAGQAYISSTRYGPMAHARLYAGEEASGKLVTMVREQARDLAGEHGRELIIIDGPPGIGCPVIAAITGVDLVLVVTEPTLSAIHDLERVLDVAAHFDIPAAVCINKHDINEENSDDIAAYCQKIDVPVVGCIPYDEAITKAMVQGKTIVEYDDGATAEHIRDMWHRVQQRLEEQ
ncbi:MAG: 4Fe-4S binding protein [Thermoplasmatota archaeon]